MKRWTFACLVGATLLAACSSDNNAGNSSGTGGTGGNTGASGYGAGGGSAHGVPGSEEDLVQSAGDRIFFDTDRSTINAQAQATLDRQASWLQQYPQVNVWAAGNCDERGTEEYNLALGERRAGADRDYLVAHGINRSRIETISYGKSRPIDSSSTPEAWAQNRNVITSIK